MVFNGMVEIGFYVVLGEMVLKQEFVIVGDKVVVNFLKIIFLSDYMEIEFIFIKEGKMFLRIYYFCIFLEDIYFVILLR